MKFGKLLVLSGSTGLFFGCARSESVDMMESEEFDPHCKNQEELHKPEILENKKLVSAYIDPMIESIKSNESFEIKSFSHIHGSNNINFKSDNMVVNIEKNKELFTKESSLSTYP